MSRLCEISRLRKQTRDELAVLESRKQELNDLLLTLDAAFEDERAKLEARDTFLEAQEESPDRWADECDWNTR
jgi:hypothetical protein